MSATVRAGTGQTGSAAGTITIAETDASPQAGDTRFAFIFTSSTGTITVPTGWTTLFNGVVATRNLAVISRSWASGVGSQNVTLAASTFYDMELVSVTGLDTSATPQVSTNGSSSAGTTATATGLTPTTGDQLALVFAAFSLTNANTTTLGTPSGTTLIHSSTAAAASGFDSVTGRQAITSTTATGNYTTTASGTGGPWVSSLLLIPSATAVAPGLFFPFLGFGGA